MSISPASDESSSEGSPLRAFVDEAIAKEHSARQAAMSPRAAILSHSSLRSDSHSNPVSEGGVIDNTVGHLRKRGKGSPRRQRGMDVARPSVLAQLVDIDISRKDPRDEVMRLREILKTVEKQAISEARRAGELERQNLEAVRRVQMLNENKLAAEQEAERANQEKRLFRLQLDNAKHEIEKSRDEVKKVEKERDEAEAAAARAREKARKLHEQQIMLEAREQGHRMGYEAGLKHAQAELRRIAASRPPKKPVKPRISDEKSTRRVDKGKGRERIPAEDTRPQSRQARQSPPSQERDGEIESIDGGEMSPSQLPLRNLPSRPPSAMGGPHSIRQHMQQTMPIQPPLQPLPAHPPRSQSRQSRQHIPGTASPEIEHWELDVPAPNQIPQYTGGSWDRNSSEAIPPLPRDQWVSASAYQQIRGGPPVQPPMRIPTFPGGQPPQMHLPPRARPLPPAVTVSASNTNITPTKAVKFPKILSSRPSLKKQAASWYRSLSQRRKNKPVIDPVPEEPEPQQLQVPTMNYPTGEAYGMPEFHPQMATPSWSHARQAMAPVGTQDYSRLRPISDAASVSTKMSHFDLLSTPHHTALSVKNGLEENRKVKDKESLLSVIKEDRSSRGNTPSSNRVAATSTGTHSIPQPDFGQPQSLHNRMSSATMNSQFTKRTSRRPPAISVPDPDQQLEPFGVAYDRHVQTNGSNVSLGYRPGYAGNGAGSGADLHRRPSRISEKTTPDTSIVIDIVPPSGIAPPVTKSPPHTGRNHLSPNIFFSAVQASPRMPSAPSVSSLRTQGGPRTDAPSQPPSHLVNTQQRPSSRAESRYTSHRIIEDDRPPEPPANYAFTPRSQRAPSVAPSNRDVRADNMSQAHKSARSLQLHTPRPEPSYLPRRPESVRPESIRSAANHNPYPSQSQLSLNNGNGNPMASRASLTSQGPVSNMGSAAIGRLDTQPQIQRMRSNTSLRSTGSFSKYNPDEYQDPAFWGPDGPGSQPVRPWTSTRPASVSSGLSYL